MMTSSNPDASPTKAIDNANTNGNVTCPGISQASANSAAPNCMPRAPNMRSARGASHIADTSPVADPSSNVPKSC